MEKITHYSNGYPGMGVCGQITNYLDRMIGRNVDVAINVTDNIENVSCEECADWYAGYVMGHVSGKIVQPRQKTKFEVLQADLDAAFKLVEAKDKEIAELERKAEINAKHLTKARHRRNLAEQELRDLREANEQLAKFSTRLDTDNAKLRGTIAELEKRNANLNERNEEMRERFKASLIREADVADKLHQVRNIVN